jgi:magnesium-transporting ATPase (P-type)
MAGRLYTFIKSNGSSMNYIYTEDSIDAGMYTSNSYGSYVILFNKLIPLSFLITLEIGKMGYAKMIEWDASMFPDGKGQSGASDDQGARVQNLTLHEQLA